MDDDFIVTIANIPLPICTMGHGYFIDQQYCPKCSSHLLQPYKPGWWMNKSQWAYYCKRSNRDPLTGKVRGERR